MSRILITGANGQLGQCFKQIEEQFDLKLVFASRETLDITDQEAVEQELNTHQYDYLINCAAYTAVDAAEENETAACLINETAVGFISKACKKHSVHLVHISTDFVFDGLKTSPYTAEDATNPKSVYGSTKRAGEERIEESGAAYSVIRASWLYSNVANNFYKTIIRLAQTKDQINVVNDQIGVPVSAHELAKQLLQLISNKKLPTGILHFAHSGHCSWMEFAQKIVEYNKLDLRIEPISTEAYGATAKRPAYSVMKPSSCFEQIPWEKALKDVVLASKH